MNPSAGARVLAFVGDRLQFELQGPCEGQQAYLRTTLGRARRQREEIIESHLEAAAHHAGVADGSAPPPKGRCWRNVPMVWREGAWRVELAASEIGYFQAKPYLLDAKGRQRWPAGEDVGIAIHPSEYRSGNTIYCAFPRMFGSGKHAAKTLPDPHEEAAKQLDAAGYAVIPKSGTLREMAGEFPHIFGTLGCKILHLLPVSPTPTTLARFGRFGSPYALQSLTAIDPALVEFDKKTTGVEQFIEMADGVHSWGGRLFLDLVINHTGWGSDIQERHPEWFLKDGSGHFLSPGAWGTVWEDLVEIDHNKPASWDFLADAFLVWCRRGVDGFRCDAGYKVPVAAWRHIIAKVQREFPKTIFLLEGLGGSWEATQNLLTTGGMHWAYSELFQNYSGAEVGGYLDYSLKQSETVGLYVHYSETHDNPRLAARGADWSLMRNQLCAMASPCGGFGFTAGVEWLATERINVHSSRGMNWGAEQNIVKELAELNRLLADHPCFADGATIRKLSPPGWPVLALERVSREGADRLVILCNLDKGEPRECHLPKRDYEAAGCPAFDLLGGGEINLAAVGEESFTLWIPPGKTYCLASGEVPVGLAGAGYRAARSASAFAIEALAHRLDPEEIGAHDWIDLARFVEADPAALLSAASRLDRQAAKSDLLGAIREAVAGAPYPNVALWSHESRRRATPVPPGHWLLVADTTPFRATLEMGSQAIHAESARVGDRHLAAFPPQTLENPGVSQPARLSLVRFANRVERCSAPFVWLTDTPSAPADFAPSVWSPRDPLEAPIVLLSNGAGAMARMCVDLGKVKSKYDCVLAANLHPEAPADRHVFVKRIRVWAVAGGFVHPLDGPALRSFKPGPPAVWRFQTPAGDGKFAEIEMTASMAPGLNTTRFRFALISAPPPDAGQFTAETRLTVRLDIEDRGFHSETKHSGGIDHHFHNHIRPFPHGRGFVFQPAPSRRLEVAAGRGSFFQEGEWTHNFPHLWEGSRGQEACGDAFSPGWFSIPLEKGEAVELEIAASNPELAAVPATPSPTPATPAEGGAFEAVLASAAGQFLARRGDYKTVIAGYPWFLDWGRDTLIAARGLLAAGWDDVVRDLLLAFGRLEVKGTMPNTLNGGDTSNRETVDAALWFGVVCEEFAARRGLDALETPMPNDGRPLAEVLRSVAANYLNGTQNGIRVDEASGLVWSPAHYTWMDTNYPAGTPRQGYAIEIQALWARLLRLLERLGQPCPKGTWLALAEQVETSMDRHFWLEQQGWISDCLLADVGVSAAEAVVDDALRCNCAFPIAFGQVPSARARRCLDAMARHLVVPGAIRTLAPLPVQTPLPIYSAGHNLLNDPRHPYWGRYEGDEDTRRKPAYHNGTAWVWPLPTFCEALAKAWDWDPAAVLAARSHLAGVGKLLENGCLGQLPEILDGDAPHRQRGCDAQAWSVTEVLRVWRLLNNPHRDSSGTAR